MEIEILEEVQNCLCGERTLYHYYPDKYALDILARKVRRNRLVSVSDLKTSNLAPLLNKPVVREVLAKSGKGQLAPDNIYHAYQQTEPYVLTIGSWGRTQKEHLDANLSTRQKPCFAIKLVERLVRSI